ncbi:MAG TPA: CoA-binding protein [Candidatus Acidoferrales bacterium]|nr:CoA-binding protein [Candidatus Acidoferrales bacterium]
MSGDPITDLLRQAKTIVVIGLTGSELRPSYGVSSYMQQQGYRIIPINPNGEEVLGEKGYKSLREIPEKVDIVDVFRRPDAVPGIVDEVIAFGKEKGTMPSLWLQETVVHEQAAEKARKAGITVIMDQCILKEHRKRAE